MRDKGNGVHDSKRAKRKGSGIQLPPRLQEDAEPVDVLMHYLNFYEEEYADTRHTAKTRYKYVVLWNSIAAGLIALVGAVVAVSHYSWMGLVSTFLAGSIGVANAWDGMFRERELWIQRSEMLGQLQLVKRSVQFRLAAGEDSQDVLREGFDLMNTVISRDLESWIGLRSDISEQNSNGPQAGK